MKDDKFLSPKEVANILGVTETTVIRMIKENRIQAIRVGAKKQGHYRIRNAWIENYIQSNDAFIQKSKKEDNNESN